MSIHRAKNGLILLFCTVFSITTARVNAQASQTVSEVITTFNFYWKSGFAAVNPLKPNTSHNLLAFTYNGTRYSTGVDDGLLTAHGDGNFIPEVFHSLPVLNISGSVTSNTKIALGQLYDGVDNGASTPPPKNNMAYYLTDGTGGLDLGTGVANLPQGDLNFNIANINPSSIGDGVPDILITQIADPSNGTDQYEFDNSSNVIVGHTIDISFSGIDAVGNWTGDFYEASTNPMVLTTSFTKSDRPLRLWAADFSYFGITKDNYSGIQKFKIHLNGNSDVAFIAYNVISSNITLPTTLSYFRSTQNAGNVLLTWQTQTEINSDHFDVESGTDGQVFSYLGSVPAAGNSSIPKNYSYQQNNVAAGPNYYRIKQVDTDGKYNYSQVAREIIGDNHTESFIYPNPTNGVAVVKHSPAKKGDKLGLYSPTGKKLSTQNLQPGSLETTVDLTSYPKGNYFFILSTSGANETIKLTLK
ncbi:MAG TPA: T9SS type A sorting domain-containing protein [Ginsengibacter sp.]